MLVRDFMTASLLFLMGAIDTALSTTVPYNVQER